MVSKELEQITSRYMVEISSEIKTNDSDFVTVVDVVNSDIQVIIHYVKNAIYAVSFLNNDFFEIPRDELLVVFESILRGDYEVKSSLGRKRYIRVKAGLGFIDPEVIHNDRPYKGIYSQLPKSFTELQR